MFMEAPVKLEESSIVSSSFQLIYILLEFTF